MRCQAKMLEQRTGRNVTKWRNDMLRVRHKVTASKFYIMFNVHSDLVK